MKMEVQKSFWEKYKYWIIISIVAIIIIGVTCFYLSIAAFFFTQNSRGELLKVLITIVGGFAIFIGLMLNNDRIKAQTEQNTISATSNFDKRFGDAIGYLGNENTSIVLGGIYALYQLAKEDKRYKSIVAGLFTSYLRDNSPELYEKEDELVKKNEKPISILAPNIPITIKTVIDLLFNNNDLVFIDESIDLSNTMFKGITFKKNVSSCNFTNSDFLNCNFLCGFQSCTFDSTRISECQIGTEKSCFIDCSFDGSDINSTSFHGDFIKNSTFNLVYFRKVTIEVNKLDHCEFLFYYYESTLTFIKIQSFIEIQISADSKIVFDNCSNKEGITYL